MNDSEISAIPASIREAIGEIGALLNEPDDGALVLQWLRPPVHHMDRAGGGAAPLVSNPTADIALDTGRLKLRATVLATARELSAIEAHLGNLRTRLITALQEYGN